MAKDDFEPVVDPDPANVALAIARSRAAMEAARLALAQATILALEAIAKRLPPESSFFVAHPRLDGGRLLLEAHVTAEVFRDGERGIHYLDLLPEHPEHGRAKEIVRAARAALEPWVVELARWREDGGYGCATYSDPEHREQLARLLMGEQGFELWRAQREAFAIESGVAPQGAEAKIRPAPRI